MAIFVPFRPYGDRDVVAAFCRLVQELALPDVAVLVVDAVSEHVDTHDIGGRSQEEIRRVVLFAHPQSENLGFSVNPRFNGGSAVLLTRWWARRNSTYETLVAHVCRGAEVLRRRPWREIFPSWVSYSGPIRAFVGSGRAEDRWKGFLSRLFTAVARRRTPAAIKEELISACHHVLAEIRDNYDAAGGDALNLMYVQECMDRLVCSSDVAETS